MIKFTQKKHLQVLISETCAGFSPKIWNQNLSSFVAPECLACPWVRSQEHLTPTSANTHVFLYRKEKLATLWVGWGVVSQEPQVFILFCELSQVDNYTAPQGQATLNTKEREMGFPKKNNNIFGVILFNFLLFKAFIFYCCFIISYPAFEEAL